MMTCESCEKELVEKRATIDSPYQYKMGGLQNVFLAGIIVYRCLRCNSSSPVIPKIGELHRVIAKGLINKPGRLAGDEIRFLRKNLGLAANDFAALLRISAERLSRVENGKESPFGEPTDKLARAIILASNNKDDIRKLLLKNMRVESDQKQDLRPIFNLEGNHWRAAA